MVEKGKYITCSNVKLSIEPLITLNFDKKRSKSYSVDVNVCSYGQNVIKQRNIKWFDY